MVACASCRRAWTGSSAMRAPPGQASGQEQTTRTTSFQYTCLAGLLAPVALLACSFTWCCTRTQPREAPRGANGRPTHLGVHEGAQHAVDPDVAVQARAEVPLCGRAWRGRHTDSKTRASEQARECITCAESRGAHIEKLSRFNRRRGQPRLAVARAFGQQVQPLLQGPSGPFSPKLMTYCRSRVCVARSPAHQPPHTHRAARRPMACAGPRTPPAT